MWCLRCSFVGFDMNRFYLDSELVIDLESVSFVGHDSAIIGGVMVKLNSGIAFDVRKQFRVYKEVNDRRKSDFKDVLIRRLYSLAMAADLIGARIHRHELSKNKLEVLRGEAN